MSMTLSSRREFYKLRELVHFLLCGAGATRRVLKRVDGEVIFGSFLCWFCVEPLDAYTDFSEHGEAVGPKFTAKLTIHHVDGNHENNALLNKALCHTKCHKSHHRKEANAQRAQGVTA